MRKYNLIKIFVIFNNILRKKETHSRYKVTTIFRFEKQIKQARCTKFYSDGLRKYILKHTQMTDTFDTKIILHNYILY